jgi:hypothetical protein
MNFTLHSRTLVDPRASFIDHDGERLSVGTADIPVGVAGFVHALEEAARDATPLVHHDIAEPRVSVRLGESCQLVGIGVDVPCAKAGITESRII